MIETHPVDTMRHRVYYAAMTNTKPTHQNVNDAIRTFAVATRDVAVAARLAFARAVEAGPDDALAALQRSPGPVYHLTVERFTTRLAVEAEAKGGDWLAAAANLVAWLKEDLATPAADRHALGIRTTTRAAKRMILRALQHLTAEVPA